MSNVYFFSKAILALFEENRELIEFIKKIETFEDVIAVNPQNIINIHEKDITKVEFVNNTKKNINSAIDQIVGFVKTKRPAVVIVLVKKLIDSLAEADKYVFSSQNVLIVELNRFIETHTDAYSERKAADVFTAVENSKKINQNLKFLFQTSKFNYDSYASVEKSPRDDCKDISIYFRLNIYNLDDFLSIAEYINEYYSLICRTLKIDPSDNPLVIRKIESASFFAILTGLAVSISKLEGLLKGIGQFLRDIITGKIAREQIENKCEAISAVIDLKKKGKREWN